jgi:hypothetical protein
MSEETAPPDPPRVDDAQSQPDPQDEYGPPFEARSFGGQYVWAEADQYTAKILRVRAGEKVVISTQGRKDMVVMLTGGRGVLEILRGKEVSREELAPATPVAIDHEQEFRLVAMTDVELFTIHSPLDDDE